MKFVVPNFRPKDFFAKKPAGDIADKENIKLDRISIIILIISGFLIVFSFLAPMIFFQKDWSRFDFGTTGQIGDTLSGIMNPFIALAGVFLTFLAFYIQFKANQLQRSLFRQELDNNKFENQFYEMLRLHKENVNEITIILRLKYFTGHESNTTERQVTGREVFKYFLYEMTILYFVAKKTYRDETADYCLNKAYSVFFHGLDYFKEKLRKGQNDFFYTKNLNEFQRVTFKEHFIDISRQYLLYLDWHDFKLFEGRSPQVAHYFRHLFQTVKFVANQSEDFISYCDKRKYLRILRAQLSNQEQAMLFYNWRVGGGATWENDENKYFTDYRMIHNLYNDLLFNEFNLIKIFNLDGEPSFRKEPNRLNDKLFEFEGWE